MIIESRMQGLEFLTKNNCFLLVPTALAERKLYALFV